MTEAGLYIGTVVAVLAFGGVAPLFFMFTQFVVLGLAIVLLLTNLRSSRFSVRLPGIVPTILVALVLLQVLPLSPRFVAALGVQSDAALMDSPRLSLSFAPYQTVSHLLLLVTYLTAFFLVLLVSKDCNARRRLVYVLVALGMFEAFYGLAQYLTGWQHIFAYVKKYYLDDATGTYINRNHFAGLLEMILPFTVASTLRLTGVLRRVALSSERPARAIMSARELSQLVFWLSASAIILTALIFSRSRMGIISALVSMVAVSLLAGTSSVSARTRLAAAGIFFVAVAGLFVWIGSDPVITRFETLGQEYHQSGQNRLSIWRDTAQLASQHPFLGVGLGAFSVAYPSVQTTFLDLRVDHAHCDYLELVSELGVPGGILVFASILWVLAGAVRHYRTPGALDNSIYLGSVGSIIAILLHSLADFNLYIPANALVFTVVLGLASSTTRNSGTQKGADDCPQFSPGTGVTRWRPSTNPFPEAR